MSRKKSELDEIIQAIGVAYDIGKFAVVVYVLWRKYKESVDMKKMRIFANEISSLMFGKEFNCLKANEKLIFKEKFDFVIGCIRWKYGPESKEVDFLHKKGVLYYEIFDRVSNSIFGKEFVSLPMEKYLLVWERAQRVEAIDRVWECAFHVIKWIIILGILCGVLFLFSN